MRRYEIINEANRIVTLADALEDQAGADWEETVAEELRKNPSHYRDVISDVIDDIIRRRNSHLNPGPGG